MGSVRRRWCQWCNEFRTFNPLSLMWTSPYPANLSCMTTPCCWSNGWYDLVLKTIALAHNVNACAVCLYTPEQISYCLSVSVEFTVQFLTWFHSTAVPVDSVFSHDLVSVSLFQPCSLDTVHGACSNPPGPDSWQILIMHLLCPLDTIPGTCNTTAGLYFWLLLTALLPWP